MSQQTIDTLADRFRTEAGWSGRFVSEEDTKRVVQAGVDKLPVDWPNIGKKGLTEFSRNQVVAVRREYRRRHGVSFNPVLIIFLEVAIKLLVLWWLKSDANRRNVIRLKSNRW